MSLEVSIAALTEVMTRVAEQNDTMIGLAQSAPAASASASDKAIETVAAAAATKKKAPAKKAEKEETVEESTGVSKAEVVKNVTAWLVEFGKPDAHPESEARVAAFKAVQGKLGFGRLSEVDEGDEILAKVHNWLETKAKVADKGFGIGRLAADPVAADEDDNLDI